MEIRKNTNSLEEYAQSAESIRRAINSRPLTDFHPLQKSKSGLYICPICGSGTGANRTGALSIRKQDNRVTCFSNSCFGDKGQDTLGAMRVLYPELTEREIFEKCGYSMMDRSGYNDRKAVKKPNNEEHQEESKAHTVANFKAEIQAFHEALAGSPGEAYLKKRGFSSETMARFMLGYDAGRQCVTIPYNTSGSYYGRRSVSDTGIKHCNLKSVTMPLFNAGALYEKEVCFVVESPLCAISIAQEGGAAVAISGTGGISRLIDQLKRKPTAAIIILCLDNDEAGKKATEEAGEKLEEINAFCVNGTSAIMGEESDPESKEYRKDPNEVLQEDGERILKEKIKETEEAARSSYGMNAAENEAERNQNTGAGMIDSFLQTVQTRKYEPLPTGITDIDKAIGGGFIRQQLVLLGAAPGAGKTALAQWIFEGMAERGKPCIFLNLEMSREQILARSISRTAAKNGDIIKTSEILQGYRWTDAQRAAIERAAQEYKEKIAERMIYNPDGVTANLNNILAYIEKEAQRAEKTGQEVPSVCIDYLQIIGGEPREETAALIKRAVCEFKSFAIRHQTVVFIIIAHNRSSNEKGQISMESGRDTSALEYSADLQLAMTYTKCLKRGAEATKTPDELTDEERKQITLRIVKGRFGGMGKEVDLYFNGETMTYSPIYKEVNESKPFDKRPKRVF